MIGLIKRNLNYLNKNTFLTLYKALARPHLEYAQCISSPYKKKLSYLLKMHNAEQTNIIKKI